MVCFFESTLKLLSCSGVWLFHVYLDLYRSVENLICLG